MALPYGRRCWLRAPGPVGREQQLAWHWFETCSLRTSSVQIDGRLLAHAVHHEDVPTVREDMGARTDRARHQTAERESRSPSIKLKKHLAGGGAPSAASSSAPHASGSEAPTPPPEKRPAPAGAVKLLLRRRRFKAKVMPAIRQPNPTTLLNQLQALNAHPECLRKPQFAEVAVWLRRVAAQLGPDEAGAPERPEAPKTRAGRKSMIPAPPTRRAITFPPKEPEPHAPHAVNSPPPPPPPPPPPTHDDERAQQPPPPPHPPPTTAPPSTASHTNAPPYLQQEPEEVVASSTPSGRRSSKGRSPGRGRSSNGSSSSLHTPSDIDVICSAPRSTNRTSGTATVAATGSPRTPKSLASPLQPPKSVRRHERLTQGRAFSLDSDASSTLDMLTPSLSPRDALLPPKSVRRARGSEAAASDPSPEPPSPPKSLRKVGVAARRSPAPARAAATAAREAEATIATPTRALRNTPARQARRDSPHPTTPKSGGRRSRARTPTSAKGAAGTAAATPKSQPKPQPQRDAAHTTASAFADEGGELDLSRFPATFQHGGGAEQLRTLHRTLREAAAPLGLTELAARLPAATSFTRERLSLLLEVMQSRKLVATHSDGARWVLRH